MARRNSLGRTFYNECMILICLIINNVCFGEYNELRTSRLRPSCYFVSGAELSVYKGVLTTNSWCC